MFQSYHDLVFVIAIFTLAGLVKGVIGFGLPTIAMGLLCVIIPPAQAAALLIVPSLVTNVWQMAVGPEFRGLLHRLWSLLIGIAAGTALGAAYLSSDMSGNAMVVLGLVLVLYAGVGMLSARYVVPKTMEWWLSPVVGLMTGFVTMETGVFVFPGVPYVQALGLQRDNLVQALGISATVSTLTLASALALHGVFRGTIAGGSLLALGPAMAGLVFGQWVRLHISQNTFRFCFFLGLLLLGMYLTKPLFG